MGPGARLAKAMDGFYDRMRHGDAFRVRREDAIPGDFGELRRHKYALVLTSRRNGDLVPSPVWMAVDGQGRLFFHTASNTGKVKRIRRDPEVLVAPSDARGKPKGSVRRGTARVLPAEEWPHAEATLAGAFGLGRKLYTSIFRMPEHLGIYIEIVPQ